MTPLEPLITPTYGSLARIIVLCLELARSFSASSTVVFSSLVFSLTPAVELCGHFISQLLYFSAPHRTRSSDDDSPPSASDHGSLKLSLTALPSSHSLLPRLRFLDNVTAASIKTSLAHSSGRSFRLLFSRFFFVSYLIRLALSLAPLSTCRRPPPFSSTSSHRIDGPCTLHALNTTTTAATNHLP